MKKTISSKGPGRPAYIPVIPRGKFTFAELCEANGVSLKGKNKGKGKNCSALTLRKFIARDAELGKKSILELTDELAAPNNKKGLGRKSFLFTRREGAVIPKSTVADAVKSAKKVSVKVAPAKSYEETKKELGIDTPAPAPAPVAETTAAEPVAVAAEPAPTAEVAPVAAQ